MKIQKIFTYLKGRNTMSHNEATLKDLERIERANVHLTFEEYAAIKEPAINAIINDYAAKIIEKAKENGAEVSLQEAREIAKSEIPAAFVPEWMKNLRIGANIAGTELAYLEQIKTSIDDVAELLSVIADGGGFIDRYVERHANDFKRMETEGGGGENGDN